MEKRPCEQDPDGWDLDRGSLQDWLGAIRACTECPFLRECQASRQRMYGRDKGPAAMVWAGRAFTSSGDALDPLALVAYASTGNRRRRAAARGEVAA